jgi:exopolysaccharide production protein ExoQ
MKFSIEAIKRFYLFLAILYYTGCVGFLNGFAKNLIFSGSSSNSDAFSQAANSASGTITTQLVGLLLLFLSLFLLAQSKNNTLLEGLKKSFWWLILIGYFVLSITWSYAPGISFRRIVAFCILIIVAFCLVQFFTRRSLLIFIAQFIGVTAVLGIIYGIIAPDKAFKLEGIRAGAFLGVYVDKNAGARIYAYAIILILGLSLYKTRIQQFLLVSLVCCLLLTQSATAAVMVFFGASLTTLFKVMRTSLASKNLARFFVLFAALVLGSFIVFYSYEFILELLGRDPTLTDRRVIWELMDKYVENEPIFGYGYGAFWSSSAVADFLERWGYIANAHSGYYEALLHGGVLCLGMLFIIMIKTLINLTKQYIYTDEGDIPAILIPIFIIQIVVNYVGFIILNHTVFDMFLFTIISFLALQTKISNVRN